MNLIIVIGLLVIGTCLDMIGCILLLVSFRDRSQAQSGRTIKALAVMAAGIAIIAAAVFGGRYM